MQDPNCGQGKKMQKNVCNIEETKKWIKWPTERVGTTRTRTRNRTVTGVLRATYSGEVVRLLRKWVSEHFDNPYPSSTQKKELALATNLTKDQISSWFINVRGRYWRPAWCKYIAEKKKEGATPETESKVKPTKKVKRQKKIKEAAKAVSKPIVQASKTSKKQKEKETKNGEKSTKKSPSKKRIFFENRVIEDTARNGDKYRDGNGDRDKDKDKDRDGYPQKEKKCNRREISKVVDRCGNQKKEDAVPTVYADIPAETVFSLSLRAKNGKRKIIDDETETVIKPAKKRKAVKNSVLSKKLPKSEHLRFGNETLESFKEQDEQENTSIKSIKSIKLKFEGYEQGIAHENNPVLLDRMYPYELSPLYFTNKSPTSSLSSSASIFPEGPDFHASVSSSASASEPVSYPYPSLNVIKATTSKKNTGTLEPLEPLESSESSEFRCKEINKNTSKSSEPGYGYSTAVAAPVLPPAPVLPILSIPHVVPIVKLEPANYIEPNVMEDPLHTSESPIVPNEPIGMDPFIPSFFFYLEALCLANTITQAKTSTQNNLQSNTAALNLPVSNVSSVSLASDELVGNLSDYSAPGSSGSAFGFGSAFGSIPTTACNLVDAMDPSDMVDAAPTLYENHLYQAFKQQF